MTNSATAPVQTTITGRSRTLDDFVAKTPCDDVAHELDEKKPGQC